MSLYILTRRTITFRQESSGETTVLLVPGIDQVQVIKDMAGTNTLKEQGAKGGQRQLKQLSRVQAGQRYIYGYLPEEIAELNTSVKVWLAEDFAPAGTQAFFFVFSDQVVLHGVREQNDEGQMRWRTAQLVLPEKDTLSTIVNAISDYALTKGIDSLTVAVFNQLELYRQLQEGLKTYGISPVPFSKMHPVAGIRPLYRHYDYTILYLALALFGIIIFAASAFYLVYTYHKRNALNDQIEETQNRIRNIKLNQSVGSVQDPQAVLQSMGKPIHQMPSAIVEAAATAAKQFGDLENLTFALGDGGDESGNSTADVTVGISNMKDALLLDQEERAAQVVAQRPWVRVIKRGGEVGTSGNLVISLQIDQAPSATVAIPDESYTVDASSTEPAVPASATTVVTPTAEPAAEASPTQEPTP